MEKTHLQIKRLKKYISEPQDHLTDLPFLLTNFNFFQNLQTLYKNTDVVQQLAPFLTLSYFKTKDPIYLINSKADKFYFILEGQVSVYLSLKSQFQIPSQLALKDSSFQSTPLTRKLTRSLTIVEEYINTNESFSLSTFESFGEELLSNNNFRQNTVVSKENTTVASLNYSDYRKVLARVKKQKNAEIKMFLRKIDLFSGWTQRNLDKVLDYAVTQDISKNQFLYKQGDKPEFVYFVKEGEFLITQNLIVPEEPKIEVRESVNGNILKLSMFRKKRNEKQVRIAIRGANEMIGVEEIINNLETRMFSCLCTADSSEIVKVSKENLFSKLLNPDLISYLQRKVDSNIKWVFSRIEAIKDLNNKNDCTQPVKQKERKKQLLVKSFRFASVSEKQGKIEKKMNQTLGHLKLSLSPRQDKINETRLKVHKYQQKKNPPPPFLITMRENLSKKKKPIIPIEAFHTLPY